jgi:hypothetical protein
MFTIRRHTEPTPLRVVIDDLIESLKDKDPTTDEYSAVADQIQKLYKLQEVDSSQRVSKETWALIAANLAGILVIVGHERFHAITTKAFGMVTRAK